MKMFVKFFILVVIFIAASCSEDLYVTGGEDGLDGQNGKDGKDGLNGYSVVTKIDPIYSPDSIIMGNFVQFYQDIDTSGNYTHGDKWLNSIYTPNGLSSRMEINFIPPTEGSECVLGSIEIKSYTGTSLTSSFSYCIPVDGIDGETYIPNITTNTIQFTEFCRIHQVYMDDNLLYADTTCDGKNGNDGDPGDDGQSYEVSQLRENCNIASSYYYDYLGWDILNTGFSINHIGAPAEYINGLPSPVYNGTMVLDDYENTSDTIWCPVFQKPSALNYLSFNIGSKGAWNIELYIRHSDGTKTFVKSEDIIPVNNFVWYLSSKYNQQFIYSINVSDIQYWDIIRWGLVITRVGDFSIPEEDWRNWVSNGDNFYYTTLEIIN